jgi:acetyl esterase/lipase
MAHPAEDLPMKFEKTSKHPIALAWTLRVAVVLTFTDTGTVFGQRTKPAGAGVALPAVEKDIPYADGGDERKLDLYLPEKAGFATVVFTYGGGWHAGSRKSVAPVGEKFKSLGFGCALLSHRLSPKDKFPAQIEDVAAAFAWVKRHIAEKGGDPERVYVMGHSSGAHLSLLLATDPKYLAGHELAPRAIAGVIGLSTPVDLEPRKDGKGFGDALMAGRGADAFSRDVEVMRGASPIRHISEGLPPVLLIVGERDFPMLKGDAAAFVNKAKALRLSAACSVAEGCDHMGVIRSFIDEKSKLRDEIMLFLRWKALR